MSTTPTYPQYGTTWGTCGTCGFAIPSHYLVMTRKHGWQCLAGSGRSRGCWDGDFDRDDIYFVYPDNEGTRDTAALLADQGTPMQFNIYVLRDSVTGILYAIDFTAPPYVLVQIALADVDPDIYNGPFDWLEGPNGQRIYVANDALTTGLFSAIYCPSAPGAVQAVPTFTTAPVIIGVTSGCPDLTLDESAWSVSITNSCSGDYVNNPAEGFDAVDDYVIGGRVRRNCIITSQVVYEKTFNAVFDGFTFSCDLSLNLQEFNSGVDTGSSVRWGDGFGNDYISQVGIAPPGPNPSISLSHAVPNPLGNPITHPTSTTTMIRLLLLWSLVGSSISGNPTGYMAGFGEYGQIVLECP